MHTHKAPCHLLLFLYSSIHLQKIFHLFSFSFGNFFNSVVNLLPHIFLFLSLRFPALLLICFKISWWNIWLYFYGSYQILIRKFHHVIWGCFSFLRQTSSLFSNLWSSFLSIPSAETTGICQHAWIQHCSHPCVELRQVRNTNYDNIILNIQGIFYWILYILSTILKDSMWTLSELYGLLVQG